MLKLKVEATELYDEVREVFINTREQELQLEHSLVSLSKWEAKWRKPFITKAEKTFEESVDYIRCMTITQNVSEETYIAITDKHVRIVTEYITAEMTATTIKNENGPLNREVITSEIIYYWMVTLNIPLEAQKWHLSRLLTLINVCNIKNSPAKKMSTRETLSRNAALNAARKAQLKSNG